MKTGGPVNPVADRRATENEEYEQLRRRLLPGPCQVCAALLDADAELAAEGVELPARVSLSCTRDATELHHRRKRSSAGALTNPANVLRSCFNGNQAVERYPIQAKHAGLAIRPGHPEWESLSARAWRKAQLLESDHQRPPPCDPLSDPPGTVSARPPAGPDPF